MTTALPAAYFHTVFQVAAAPPYPAAFAVITAWHPQDRPLADAENARADHALRQDLESRGVPHFRVTGCSPDLSHCEPGWAAVIEKPAALELGRRYDQRAIWWVEQDALHLLTCADGEERTVATFTGRIVKC